MTITPTQILAQIDHIAKATAGNRDDHKERLAIMTGFALMVLVSIDPAFTAVVARIEEMTRKGTR